MKIIKEVLILVFSCAIVFLFFNLMLKEVGIEKKHSRIPLERGWTVIRDEEKREDVNIQMYKALNAVKGEKITFICTLPIDSTINNASVQIVTYLNSVKAFVNDKEVFSFGENTKGDFTGYGRMYFELPDDYRGKVLRIEVTALENDGIANVNPPVIIPTSMEWIDLIREEFLNLAISVSLMCFGICMILLSLFSSFKSSQNRQLIYLGFFSVNLAIWMFGKYNFFQLVNTSYTMKTFTEYLGQFLSGFFFLLFFGAKTRQLLNRVFIIIFNVLACSLAVLLVITVILHTTGLVHITQMLSTFHFLFLLISLLIVVCLIYTKKIRKDINYSFLAGLLAMGIGGAIDIVIFNLDTYTMVSTNGQYGTITSLCSLTLVFEMLFDLLKEMERRLKEDAKSEVYEKLALTDELTRLSNLRQVEMDFDEIEKTHSSFAVLAFDTNDLKKINDNKGHEMGDRYLCAVADILREVFGTVGTVARVGGDEFTVVIKDIGVLNLESLLGFLDEKSAAFNNNNKEFQISVARGVATFEENLPVREAYRLADQRMYDNKALMKANRKARLKG